MVYLLLGPDLKAKDAKISQIKSAVFKSPDALLFDLETIDAQGLQTDVLKKALITLPVVNPKRLVIVNNIHKLKNQDIASLIDFLKNPGGSIDLILETNDAVLKGDQKDITSLCTTQVFDLPKKADIFQVTRLMTAGRQKEALNTLSDVFAGGDHPLRVLGGLGTFWGKDGRRLAPKTFELGLKALEEADVNIKRSRLDPQYAVEKVVVELSGFFVHR